ncbi:MAG: helix-turn-helix transcriptional regulator, partial [Prevotella sp.]|nr:helix-turn-helix transcriptional regulator [Prevotella sp.]
KKLMSYIEENIAVSDIVIEDMAAAVGLSRTGLYRKVKNLIGTSPMEFIREARIRKAAHLLGDPSVNVSEVAYDCGFSDPKYFSKCFKAATGQTPTEYKKTQSVSAQ